MKNIQFRPLQPQPLPINNGQRMKKSSEQGTFTSHLNQALENEKKLILSKHASRRLTERNIQINESRWSQIEEKIFEAKQKGVKDSLVLLSDAALIVSAKNNTVITAMNRQEATSQVFTNINGAIILE